MTYIKTTKPRAFNDCIEKGCNHPASYRSHFLLTLHPITPMQSNGIGFSLPPQYRFLPWFSHPTLYQFSLLRCELSDAIALFMANLSTWCITMTVSNSRRDATLGPSVFPGCFVVGRSTDRSWRRPWSPTMLRNDAWTSEHRVLLICPSPVDACTRHQAIMSWMGGYLRCRPLTTFSSS